MAPPAGFAPRKALAVKNVETSDVSSRAPFVSAATVKRRLSLKAKEKEKEKPARLRETGKNTTTNRCFETERKGPARFRDGAATVWFGGAARRFGTAVAARRRSFSRLNTTTRRV
jgi:hypothetical protein